MEKEIKKKEKDFRPYLGELMKEVLNKQRKKVIKACYGHASPSYKEVGEIIAQKIIDNKLI
ncbi:MAG: hypothetical protein ACLFUH_06915 [Bacteroidales bacterium]